MAEPNDPASTFPAGLFPGQPFGLRNRSAVKRAVTPRVQPMRIETTLSWPLTTSYTTVTFWPTLKAPILTLFGT